MLLQVMFPLIYNHGSSSWVKLSIAPLAEAVTPVSNRSSCSISYHLSSLLAVQIFLRSSKVTTAESLPIPINLLSIVTVPSTRANPLLPNLCTNYPVHSASQTASSSSSLEKGWPLRGCGKCSAEKSVSRSTNRLNGCPTEPSRLYSRSSLAAKRNSGSLQSHPTTSSSVCRSIDCGQ